MRPGTTGEARCRNRQAPERHIEGRALAELEQTAAVSLASVDNCFSAGIMRATGQAGVRLRGRVDSRHQTVDRSIDPASTPVLKSVRVGPVLRAPQCRV